MRAILLVVTSVLLVASVDAQSISQKKDVAVFRLGFYDLNVPANALGRLDSQIEDVFINLGRFNIIGMSYRLSEDDVTHFIDKLKELKTSQAAIPESFNLGKEAFTEADLNRLAGSFLIVVPILDSYSLHYQQSTGYTAELDTFTFISAQTTAAIAHFSIRTIGTGIDPEAAVADASSAVPVQLQFQIRSIPEFQLKTGIVDVEGTTVLIQFGRNMGVRPGDDYAIVSSRILPSGLTVTDQTGLLTVKEVQDQVSYAKVIYSKERPRVGDQLKELPRMGFESTFYFHELIGTDLLGFSQIVSPVATAGVIETVTRGFYNFRPLIGAELPFLPSPSLEASVYGTGGLPVNLFIGGELNWRVWRIDIVPLAAVGIGGLVPLSSGNSFEISLGGGFVQLGASYLVSPQVKLFVDLGFAKWFPVSTAGLGYEGAYGGVGIAVNY